MKADRIHQARRNAIRSLMDLGMDLDEAGQWCDAWEAEAARQRVVRDPYYWDAGRGWIDAQYAATKAPPP